MVRKFTRKQTVFVAVLILLAVATCYPAATGSSQNRQPGYFDAHNHGYSAILPYYAYADLDAYIRNPGDPTRVDLDHRRELWRYIVSAEPKISGSPLTGPANRYAPGAIATIHAYGKDIAGLSAAQVNGALQRVLTATPWTEFDNAYAFRGSAIDAYLSAYFDGDRARLNKAVCDATIVSLAATDTPDSEQFISWIGGWGFTKVAGQPTSNKLDTIRCFLNEPQILTASGVLKALKKPAPHIRILLMTHTSELSDTSDQKDWLQYATTGSCAPAGRGPAATSPAAITQALLGRDADGAPIILPAEQKAYFNGVIGIDTAAPEFNCFTSSDSSDRKGAGMEVYKRLVRAVYAAARERRSAGWHGKLLAHTHVGEGGITYQITDVPSDPDNARKVFEKFPDIWRDPATGQPVHIKEAGNNVKQLLQAVKELKDEIKDIDSFVVFRFGHVTHADLQDAKTMKQLGIEADINLESNISTGAYYTKDLYTPESVPFSESQQFDYNSLAGKVIASGRASEVLSGHSLKFMLAAGVRTLLGSDGAGTEHSSIRQEYQLAGELIRYWSSKDPEFKRLGLSVNTIYNNVEAHRRDMQSDTRLGSSPVKHNASRPGHKP